MYTIADIRESLNDVSPVGLGLLALDDLETVDDVDLGRPGGAVDEAEGLEFQADGEVLLGALAVHVVGLFEERWLLLLGCRSGESAGRYEGANYHEFQHLEVD